MSTISKQHREKLQRKITSANDVPVKDTRIDADDLDALLQIADRHDQYWQMLNDLVQIVEQHQGVSAAEKIKQQLKCGEENEHK